jgi:hypothetical protein
VEPTELTGKYYIQKAYDLLLAIINNYCPDKKNCRLDKNTANNINSAISLIHSALGYFGSDDNHLNTRKGLSFYDNITSGVNDIYAYTSNPDFGDDIEQALSYLFQGAYIITVAERDDAAAAIQNNDCKLSNCDETLKSANTELGKAIDDSKQDNYVYIFNHLTNSWKFSANILGANLKKENSIEVNIPKEYGLSQNYPNPFNPATTIKYQLPQNNHVTLRIYDVLGNLVTTLIDEDVAAGYHSVTWSAGNIASGVYFYRLTSGSFISTKKLILMK